MKFTINDVREYCLTLPQATCDFPFDEEVLAFRIGGKIFSMVNLDNNEWFVLKCDPDYAVELRGKYDEITPGWHMNKKYWNQIDLKGNLEIELVLHLIRHSYNQVVAKLPGKYGISPIAE